MILVLLFVRFKIKRYNLDNNKDMPYQVYNPATKVQTTYNGANAASGVAKTETVEPGTSAPAPVTTTPPTSTPVAAPSTTTPKPNITLPGGQVISGTDPNYAEYAKQVLPADQIPNESGLTMEQANTPGNETPATIKAAALIKAVNSGQPMDEATAREYAASRGETNWQKYVNGVNGQLNPNYIGAASYKRLQTQYTPYQIEQATIRTKDGIYWNPQVNIGTVPATNPGDKINKFAKDVANAVASGTKKEDPLAPKDETGAKADATATETPLAADSTDMNTALGIFNSVMNTPGMDDLKSEVTAAKAKVDAYDQQMEELTDDIRKEVEGEAPESYINALAAVRGNSIMRLRRSAERDYNTALANFNSEKELKTSQVNMMVNDANNRYNRAFQALQFAETKAQNAKSYEAVKLNAMLTIPEGKSYTFKDGTTVQGMKENDNIQTGTFTDANNNIYYYAIDKKTGKEAFPKVLIGKAKATGGGSPLTPVQELANYKAGIELQNEKQIQNELAAGTLGTAFDDKGKQFYYNKAQYDIDKAAYEASKSDYIPFNKKPEPNIYDYQKY